MKRLLILKVLFAGFAYMTASATIINIPADYHTIQQGIDASSDGDTVLVQPGTYYENINFNGHNIVLGSLFLTTGDTSYIEQTIIDGDSAGSVVTFENGEDNTAIISGFTIQNGSSAALGGGISCIYSGPTITYNHIRGNSSIGSHMIDGTGGGIYCSYSDATISHNTIKRNLALGLWTWGFGGGIYCWTSNPKISDNSIFENHAGGEWGLGGGISLLRSSPIINNNVIVSNSALHWGGGIHCFESSPIMVNNTLGDNSAWQGGAIYCEFSSNSIITNTICWADSAEDDLEIWADTSSTLTITYCNIKDSLWAGPGNISADPLFRDTASGDFHLMSIACGDSADSPCIDAGDLSIFDNLLDCSWGMGGPRSDMGAYGGGDSLITGIFDNMPSMPDRFMLLQNYPNPFNAQTTIRFVLPQSQNVLLTVYDLLGRRVEKIIDEYMQAGVHNINFDASNLSSGVYFYRLEAGDRVETKRMVLLK
ncbi:MAG: T9SS type A sorting domain-containing protein [Candidatus Zixiibacteriota bacterium]|nr:MAG: T9SS type A sorting domain-containing protein [candidate division Zixibacteria bacterium]